MGSSFEELVFSIIASDKDASAAFDRFRRSVDNTSSSVDKNSTALDRNAKSLDKHTQSNKSALGAMIGVGLAFAPITAGAAAASAGFSAFAALAVPSAVKISKAMTGPGGLAAAWSTLDARQRTAAVGVTALGDRYTGLAKAMEPRVFQVFNQGLGLANSLLGPVGKLAAASGLGISDFLAQFSADSGLQHFIAFLSSQARPAFDSLGSDVTHLAHAVFQLLQSFGGVGLLELRALTGVFTALDTSITFLSQHAPGLTSVALGVGGIALALSKIGALSGVLKVTGLAGIAGQMTGFAEATRGATLAEKGMLATTTALDAISPLGWVLLAGAGVAALAVTLSRFRSVTDGTIKTIEAQNHAQGFNTAGYYAAALALSTYAQSSKGATEKMVNLHTGMVTGTTDAGQLSGATKELTDAQQKLVTQAGNQEMFLTALENKYGLTRAQAIALAGASGVLASTVNKGGKALRDAVTQSEAFRASLVSAQNPASQMNADLFVMNANAVNAASGVTKINTAWATFLGMSTGVETAQLGIITNLRQMAKDAAASGASFTGVNKSSVALQTDFEGNLAPSIQGIIGNAKTARASMHDLATVISTDLKPAVDRGALANKGMRQQIFDMAQQAGYTGPNRVKPLTDFIDSNATSLRKADALTRTWSADLAKVPKTEHADISVTGLGHWSVSQSLAPGAGHRRAAGGYIGAGTGPTADDVPVWASKGEYFMKASSVAKYGVGMMDQINAGRFAAGGVVGKYGPASLAGLGPWVSTMDDRTLTAIEAAVARATAAGIRSAQSASAAAGFSAAGPGGGAPGANAALARRMFPQWSSGALWDAWNYVEMREAGWNQFARNASSGAYGIPQALPPSKMGPAANPPQSNPAAQISWMAGYMTQRYGGPLGAAAHERAFNWYDQGAWQVPQTGPAFVHQGEMIIAAELAGAVRQVVSGGGGSGLPAGGHGSGGKAMQAAGMSLAGFYSGGGGTVAGNLAEMRLFLRDIAKYFSGSSAQWRDAEVRRQTARLDSVVGRLDAVKATIASARSYQQSVQSGLSGYADLSSLTAPGQGLSTGSQLQVKLMSLKGFAAVLKRLSALHLPSSLMRQVVALGPDQGTAFGQEIISGGPALVKALAGTEAAIGAAELGISRGAASDVYTGKYRSGKDFLAGLTHEQAALQKLFRGLGEQLGREASRWFDVPPAHHHAHHRQGGGGSGPPGHGGGGGSGRAGNTYVIHVHVPQNADKREFGRLAVEAIREFEKGSGKGWRS